MLRTARVPPMGSLVDGLRTPTIGQARDLLLAMAPLPRGVAYKVEGWPSWLLPAELALVRSSARAPLQELEDPPPP